MKRFNKTVFIFLLPILALLAVMEYSLRKIPNDYSFKRSYLDKNAQNLEVLFLGNSHICVGINPAYISHPAFNAAYFSQSLDIDLAILRRYQDKLTKLKCLVVPVDYFSLYSTMEAGAEKWRLCKYNIYYGLNLNNNEWNKFEVTGGKFAFNLPRLKNFYVDGNKEVTCNSLGWSTTYKSSESKDLTETGKVAAKRHTIETKDNPYLSRNIETLNSIIAIAKDVKLIFITCPAYKTYTSNLNQTQLNNTVATVSNIASQHNFKYYNFLNDPAFTEKDFYDGDHLNEIGAKKLSMKVDSLINVIY